MQLLFERVVLGTLSRPRGGWSYSTEGRRAFFAMTQFGKALQSQRFLQAAPPLMLRRVQPFQN